MSVQLYRTDDPREPLERAHRWELFEYAQREGVTQVRAEMPARVMRTLLRRAGKTNIKLSPRNPLGAPPMVKAEHQIPEGPVPEVDADNDLMRQWEQQINGAPVLPDLSDEDILPEPKLDAMKFSELRKLAKDRGIKQSPKDTKVVLLEKLRGENAP